MIILVWECWKLFHYDMLTYTSFLHKFTVYFSIISKNKGSASNSFFFGLMVVCEVYFYQDHIHLPTLFLCSLYRLFLGNQISKDWITRMGEKKSFHAWTEATQIFRSWVGEGTAFGAFNQVCRCNDASYPFIWPTLQNNCFLISPW